MTSYIPAFYGKADPADPTDVRFPFHADKAQVRAFLHGQAAELMDDKSTIQSILLSAGPSLVVSCGKDYQQAASPIARYADDGSLLIELPFNPMTRSFVRPVWNYLLGVLGAPRSRVVQQVWTGVSLSRVRSMRNGGPEMRYRDYGWPVERWKFDGQFMEVRQPLLVCDRQTMDAWRTVSPNKY